MDIILSLALFLGINFGIYFLLRFWKDYDDFKSASETLFLYKTYTEAELIAMHKELFDEEIRLNKLNKFYRRKLNIKNAIELSRSKAMTHKKQSQKFADEVIYSLRNSKN